MKKKEEQRLLKFPSVFNLEPGGKSGEGQTSPKVPAWKKEVARKVEQHLQKRDLKKDGVTAGQADQLMETTAEKKALDQRFSAREKPSANARTAEKPTIDLPPRQAPGTEGQAKPRPGSHRISHPPREEVKQDLKQEFANLAQQFKKVKTGSTQEIELDEQLPEAHPSFDEVDLAKNPAPTLPEEIVEDATPEPIPEPDPQPTPDESREEAEELRSDDYFMPLGELLERHHKKEISAPIAERTAGTLDRTILVSRFLAGLIDFVLILSMNVGLVAITSYFTGRDPFSAGMGWFFTGMLVFMLYVYSFFFLYLSGRTVGMMLVGLQVIAGGDQRLPLGTALLRITVFLAATGLLFIGLIWGIVRRDARCWQDILTDSDVIRVD